MVPRSRSGWGGHTARRERLATLDLQRRLLEADGYLRPKLSRRGIGGDTAEPQQVEGDNRLGLRYYRGV
ncbi:MAG: hypothetical protein CVT64_02410 [Actinobacteria bacterium HGW-Actinobacteria-4]|nr:MAG: hypothetical protein CVT64_02410 [Actinobacteria bacterium HGW-Actinobacteria-4]